ncbi:alpha/beta hydrolase [Devosia sp. 2618]|uniref:alpha/beta fold hydrolase n=1 Tax=Devosia sp. 2618 TaxID=3156454 RepID=UPI0033936846
MTNKTVKAGDITINYTELGDGPPLLLLHGGLATAETSWDSRYPQLTEHFHVYAPDTRGHGLTDNPSGRLGYDQFADDAVAFCRALGIEQPLIVGYSDGGQACIELGLRHPGFARAMAVGGTISYLSQKYEDDMRSFGFTAPGEADHDKIRSGWGDFFDTIELTHRGDGAPGYLHRLLAQVSTLWLTVPHYTVEQLQSIPTPTLIINGDRDHMAGLDQAQRLYENIPNSELAIVPNATHGAVDLDLFWVLVLDFLKRQVAGRPPT